MKLQELLTLLLINFLAAIAAIFCFSFLYEQPDSPSYLNAIQRLAGVDAPQDRLQRLVKPTALIFPTFSVVCLLI